MSAVGTRLLLLRHGQSTWNAEGRWQGQEDPPLSVLGEAQAREAAERLGAMGTIDAVWASDLVRAQRTAEVLAAWHGVDVALDRRLRERHAGPWQGKTRAEIEALWPGYLSEELRPEGYEPSAELLARALASLDAIADAHPGATLVVVSHGGVLGVVEQHLGGHRKERIPNLGGRELRADGAGGWALGDAVVLLGDDMVTVPGQL